MRKFDVRIPWIALAFLASPMYADCCKNAVAVVQDLSGSLIARSKGSREKITVSKWDCLSEGMTIEAGAASQAVLILLNGQRYELSAAAKVLLTADDATKLAGAVRKLSPLPPIPKPAGIVADATSTSGAARVRGAEEMSHLYPRIGMVALPDKVTLHFRAVPEATSYRVALDNDSGDTLINVTTESTEVPLPVGTLEAGANYSWRVRAMRSGIAIGFGEASFTTLSADDNLHREEFANALGATSNASAKLALLGDVDLRLGLVAEACEEFNEALKQIPDDNALRRALDACKSTRDGK